MEEQVSAVLPCFWSQKDCQIKVRKNVIFLHYSLTPGMQLTTACENGMMKNAHKTYTKY